MGKHTPSAGKDKSQSLPRWDVFVSYASEDKDFVVRLADELKALGVTIWYDDDVLEIGDKIRRTIEHGLANSRWGIVIISQNFFRKEYPQKELDALVSREVEGENVILPVWHDIAANEVRQFSPLLADKKALSSDLGTEELARKLAEKIGAQAPKDKKPAEKKATRRMGLSIGSVIGSVKGALKEVAEIIKAVREILIGGAAIIAIAGTIFYYITAIPSPTELSPTAGTVFEQWPSNMELRWNAISVAEKYGVEIERYNGDWDSLEGGFVSNNNYPFIPGEDDKYQWRVWAVGSWGRKSSKTEWSKFSLGDVIIIPPELPEPQQLFPPDGAALYRLPPKTDFSWSPVPGATGYMIEIDRYDRGGTPGWHKNVTGSAFYSEALTRSTDYTFTVIARNLYRWRVWAIDDAGRTSPKSNWREFRYTIPEELSAAEARMALKLYKIAYTKEEFANQAKLGDRQAVIAFLKAGMDPNERVSIGYTALMMAATEGQIDVVRALLEDDRTDPTINHDAGYRALHLASFFGHEEIKLLLKEAERRWRERRDNSD